MVISLEVCLNQSTDYQHPPSPVDVVYTKIYEANSSSQHASEQNSLCYDQKLGWCMTKAAPHEHENSKELG